MSDTATEYPVGYDPRLAKEVQNINTLPEPEYWRKLCPWLGVESENMLDYYDEGRWEVEEDIINTWKERMRRDGFFVVKGCEWGFDLSGLEAGVEQLLLHGWQATYITMYDEAYAMPYRLQEVIDKATGCAKPFNFDFLGYHVAPPTEAGMPPHRDFPHCPASSWCEEDEMLPKIVSCWVALSEVDSFNSCLYMLPACRDPKYKSGANEPATEIFTTNESFQDIVALQMSQGDFVVFSHRVYHWGSSSSPLAANPRVALAFGFSDSIFKPSYLTTPDAFPASPLRFHLNSAQMIIYNKRHEGPWPLTTTPPADFAFLSNLYALLRTAYDCLDPTYTNTIEASPVLQHLRNK